jgi:hypothetical protein
MSVVNKLLPIPTAVIEQFHLIMPGIGKRLSESFYESVEIKQAILRKEPTSLKSCTEWLNVLASVQNATEQIRDRYQQIVDFYKVMEEFQINKNQKTADAAVVRGITDAFNSLIDTAETSKDQKTTYIQNYSATFEKKVAETTEKVRNVRRLSNMY